MECIICCFNRKKPACSSKLPHLFADGFRPLIFWPSIIFSRPTYMLIGGFRRLLSPCGAGVREGERLPMCDFCRIDNCLRCPWKKTYRAWNTPSVQPFGLALGAQHTKFISVSLGWVAGHIRMGAYVHALILGRNIAAWQFGAEIVGPESAAVARGIYLATVRAQSSAGPVSPDCEPHSPRGL